MAAMFARVLGLSAVVWSLASGGALANGGIEGTIRLAGPAPVVAARPIAKDANVCGGEAPAESVVVGKAGALANVVVSVTDARFTGAPPPSPARRLDQRRCRYAPHVQAVTVGTPLAVMNNDAILHNVHGNEAAPVGPALTVFNLAMPIKGQKLPVPMRKPGLIRVAVRCGPQLDERVDLRLRASVLRGHRRQRRVRHRLTFPRAITWSSCGTSRRAVRDPARERPRRSKSSMENAHAWI